MMRQVVVVAELCHRIQKKDDFISFCLTLNFTDSWLKQFKTNYLSQTTIYCEEMHKLLKKTPISLPEPDDCKNKRQLLLTDIGGEWKN